MKKCNNCGFQTQDTDMFCSNCGSNNLSEIPTMNGQAFDPNGQPFPQTNAPMPETGINDNGNVAMGFLGAALFGLAGAVLYFIMYQIGIIAGICGLVMFIAAQYGYNMLAKPQKKNPTVSLVIAIVVTIVLIFVAEYVSVTYSVCSEFNDLGVNVGFFDVFEALPELLTETDLWGEFYGDLAFAYIAGGVGIVINIVSAKKAKQ